MMSAARLASLIISDAASRASGRSGSSRSINRTHVSAFVTAAPIGCLISCASEAVSSPMVLTRFMCARSACSFSARLRSSMSFITPYHLTIFPRLSRTGTARVRNHRYLLPAGAIAPHTRPPTPITDSCHVLRSREIVGMNASCHPQPKACFSVRPVYSTQRPLTNVRWPSGLQ